ncbi:MAG: crotonase/enoyl-CoA hydratase family protein [Gammaproteobacteria bacterium]|nr:crotonase/enoyl-CoA hydratase family protein [Gammaproteobacteria bacterium]
MTYTTIELKLDERGVATLTLNRPESHNAMNAVLIDEVRHAVAQVDQDPKVRVVVLTGVGKSFCAGGDLNWMQGNLNLSRAERVEQSGYLADMLSSLNTLSKPLVGRINGPAYGGGVGMVSVCDLTVASDRARFCLTEVRLGLTPATISPFVVERMGLSNARRTFLNARMFSAAEAVELQLISEVVPEARLDEVVNQQVESFLICAPGAIAMTKALIRNVAAQSAEENRRYTAEQLADAWDTEEGQTGIRCFLEKKAPPWRESLTDK